METQFKKTVKNQKGQSVLEIMVFGLFFASLLVILKNETTAHKEQINKFKNKGFKYENRATR